MGTRVDKYCMTVGKLVFGSTDSSNLRHRHRDNNSDRLAFYCTAELASDSNHSIEPRDQLEDHHYSTLLLLALDSDAPTMNFSSVQL